MIKNFTKKGIAMLLLVLSLFSVFSNVFAATPISSALIKNGGDCGYHLQYWDGSKWSYVKTTYVYYEEGGNQYPAYCMQPSLPGVGESSEYNVSVDDIINDVRLWRVAINGYPYTSRPECVSEANAVRRLLPSKNFTYKFNGSNKGFSIFIGLLFVLAGFGLLFVPVEKIKSKNN